MIALFLSVRNEEKNMSSTEKKFKKFSLSTYAMFEDVEDILEEKFKEGTLNSYAFALHDMDFKDDGTRKEPHIHIVFETTSHRTLTSVCNWFKGCKDFKGERANTFGECTKVYDDGTVHPVDLKGATYYLVHENKNGEPLGDGKHHYSWEDVCSKNLEMLKNPPMATVGRKPKEDKTFEILESMMEGENPYILAKKYGRDFILNFRKYTEVIVAISKCEEQRRQTEEIKNKQYQEMSRALYVLCDDGTVSEMSVECLEQNAQLKREREILLNRIAELEMKEDCR